MPNPSPASAHHPLQVPAGLLIWCLWFAVFYGSLSFACMISPPGPGPFTWLNGGLALFTLTTFALLAWRAWRAWQLTRAPGQLSEHQQALVCLSGYVYTITAATTLLMGGLLLSQSLCL